jgi:predicted nucleic acid-binding protein
LAALLQGRPAVVSLITPWLNAYEVATSIVVYGEVIEYLKARPDFTSRRSALRVLLGDVYPYFLFYRVLERYAEIRRQLRARPALGLIGDIDTLIAATALERDLTVVTTDGDFERVPGLQVLLIDRAELRRR